MYLHTYDVHAKCRSSSVVALDVILFDEEELDVPLSEPSGLLQPGTERTILQPQKCIVITSYIYVLEMRLHESTVNMTITNSPLSTVPLATCCRVSWMDVTLRVSYL